MATNNKAAIRAAEAAGYYVRRGEFVNAYCNRRARWYVGHHGNGSFLPICDGYRTKGDAWTAALHDMRNFA
ncbi:MAG: hypothetical protein NVS2B11_15240 [Acetobacteraceae bacterium]